MLYFLLTIYNSKVNITFDLTNSFKYNHKKEKTQVQDLLKLCLVTGTEKLANLIIKEL